MMKFNRVNVKKYNNDGIWEIYNQSNELIYTESISKILTEIIQSIRNNTHYCKFDLYGFDYTFILGDYTISMVSKNQQMKLVIHNHENKPMEQHGWLKGIFIKKKLQKYITLLKIMENFKNE